MGFLILNKTGPGQSWGSGESSPWSYVDSSKASSVWNSRCAYMFIVTAETLGQGNGKWTKLSYEQNKYKWTDPDIVCMFQAGLVPSWSLNYPKAHDLYIKDWIDSPPLSGIQHLDVLQMLGMFAFYCWAYGAASSRSGEEVQDNLT